MRETRRWARLIERKQWVKNDRVLDFVLRESEELIRIFYSSIQTAQKNSVTSKRPSSASIRYPSAEPVRHLDVGR